MMHCKLAKSKCILHQGDVMQIVNQTVTSGRKQRGLEQMTWILWRQHQTSAQLAAVSNIACARRWNVSKVGKAVAAWHANFEFEELVEGMWIERNDDMENALMTTIQEVVLLHVECI